MNFYSQCSLFLQDIKKRCCFFILLYINLQQMQLAIQIQPNLILNTFLFLAYTIKAPTIFIWWNLATITKQCSICGFA